MQVNESDEAPIIYLMINDLTDAEFRFDINLYRVGDLEQAKEMIVALPEASRDNNGDPVMLEKNAYEMIDTAITAILNDKDIKSSLVRTHATTAAAAEKKAEGTLIGIVKTVNIAANEVVVGSGRIAYSVNIGDIVYAEADGVKISMEVNFPMQTIAKCRVLEKDKRNITKIKSGDKIYK
jgi:hypothetical protein